MGMNCSEKAGEDLYQWKGAAGRGAFGFYIFLA